jgi:hypothetical protein
MCSAQAHVRFTPKADIEARPRFRLVQSANLPYVFRCERLDAAL